MGGASRWVTGFYCLSPAGTSSVWSVFHSLILLWLFLVWISMCCFFWNIQEEKWWTNLKERAHTLFFFFFFCSHLKKWGCMGAGLQNAAAEVVSGWSLWGGPLMGETPTSWRRSHTPPSPPTHTTVWIRPISCECACVMTVSWLLNREEAPSEVTRGQLVLSSRAHRANAASWS